jgi:hypothetical protein
MNENQVNIDGLEENFRDRLAAIGRGVAGAVSLARSQASRTFFANRSTAAKASAKLGRDPYTMSAMSFS